MSKNVTHDYMVVPNENADPRNYTVSRFIPGTHPIDDLEFILDLPQKEIILQQYYNSCVGHAFAMAKMISEYQKTKKWIDFDPYIIYGTRFKGDYTGKGMVLDQGAKALYKEGAFYERDFGKKGEMPSIKEEVEEFKAANPDLVEAAKAFKIEGYAYVDWRNPDEMKAALKAGMPIVVGINAWQNMGNNTDGVIHCNTSRSGRKDTGRHAVCVVGWVTKKDRPYWIIINSWGIFQGYKGLIFWDSKRKMTEAISITDTITPVKAKCKKVSFKIGDTSFIADGEIKSFEAAPYIKKSRTYLPVRFVAENLGASVEWDAETGTATIRSEEAVIKITHKSKYMYINDVPCLMDVTPEIVNNRMMAPIRHIAEALNCSVEWIEHENMVVIKAL